MSSSEDEGDGFFGRLEADGLFDESDVQRAKREEAVRFVSSYAQREWGLAARQRRAAGAVGDELISEGELALVGGRAVRFLEKQGQQAKVWDCALVLAKFLTAPRYFPEGFFADKRVIELGCGVGVPGLAAALLGAREVVLTDFPQAMPWIRANIELNRSGMAAGSRCEALPLLWGEPVPSELAPVLERAFDVVLCSDLVYGEPSISRKLVQTLRRLTHRASLVVSAHEARFAGDRGASFLDLLRAEGFSVRAVPVGHLDAVYRADGIHVHLISPPSDA